MAVLEQSQQQKIISSSLIGALFCAVAVYTAVLISYSSSLSNTTGIQVGKIGVLTLFEVSKHSIGGGNFEAGFKIFFGQLGIYFGVWLILGMVVAKFRVRPSRSVVR